MRVPLPGGSYVNVAHISLISGIRGVVNNPESKQFKLLLMGAHQHVVSGPADAITALHKRLADALDLLDAGQQ